ncbi:MAG TPA: thermonuclease family protein [Dongiaceae bacterium]|nr:thermonuclease family protein [Dongiaceae bacterium]
MARSRAVARGRPAIRVFPVVPVMVAALLGSIGWGWWTGGRITARIPVTVIHVVDGDTLLARFRDGHVEKVRLLGVDTPEVVDPRKPVQCFGPEASAFSKARLTGRRALLELDAEPRDKYGRLLAYLIVKGHRFDDELLVRGYARFLVIPPNGSHARALLRAELAARAAGRGLWGAC